MLLTTDDVSHVSDVILERDIVRHGKIMTPRAHLMDGLLEGSCQL